MNFGLTSEQEMIIESVKSFVEKELYPFEDEVEKNNKIEDSVVEQIKQKSIESGLYACNMPEISWWWWIRFTYIMSSRKRIGKSKLWTSVYCS